MMAELSPVPFGRCRGRWRDHQLPTVLSSRERRGSGFRRAMGGAGAREGGRGRLRPQRCCRVGAAGRGAGWGRCSSARGRSKRAQTACPAKSASEDHGQEWSGWALARAPGGRAANGWYESDTVVCREEVHMLIYSPDPPNTPFPISGSADLETAQRTCTPRRPQPSPPSTPPSSSPLHSPVPPHPSPPFPFDVDIEDLVGGLDRNGLAAPSTQATAVPLLRNKPSSRNNALPSHGRPLAPPSIPTACFDIIGPCLGALIICRCLVRTATGTQRWSSRRDDGSRSSSGRLGF